MTTLPEPKGSDAGDAPPDAAAETFPTVPDAGAENDRIILLLRDAIADEARTAMPAEAPVRLIEAWRLHRDLLATRAALRERERRLLTLRAERDALAQRLGRDPSKP